MSDNEFDAMGSTKRVEADGGSYDSDAQSLSFGQTPPVPSDRIGRYLLLQKLGQGAFGVVYRAQDEVLKRFVALKLLTRFESSAQIDAWVTEARVLASLDHPAIVPVFDIGKTEAGQPFIVSKLIDGGSLTERSTRSDWSLEDSTRVVTQLAHSLDYLHRRGVMHRDIKPSNILTTLDGNAVLADFGLALPESGYGKGSRFVGTPAYMSPEQARYEGHRVDGRSDIYSLGVVFYELMTGSRPFRAQDQQELLDCIRNVEVRPLRQLNSAIPRELERICMRALAKKVSDRYSTAADLADDLDSWIRQATHGFSSEQSRPVSERTPELLVSSAKSMDLDSVAVVPHGLRPFDAADSDFFRYLLPGARDRNNIPDSISFWTHRILSRNQNEAFRIGVLLGVSGSGKSSILRAGVLPLVADATTSIYVEAKPDGLEENILKHIRRAMPELETERTLRETLIRIRQKSNKQHGPKLLIVIDQFEQWLNYHRHEDTTDLHDSLRQCDGANIQTILSVRDDFMLGISSFMDQLDEPLLQNQNFATVEPFGVVHARKVLTAFGRAYGSLQESLTSEQASFIDDAIQGLARIGRLEPVQIALLADMIKRMPWQTSTLRELGGIEGLGVAFLEEKLAGASAHPFLRSQLPIVRRILRELLPADDTVIKPPACVQSVMLERLEGIASEETLCRLLQLIDTEVRLITPTSSAANLVSSTGSSTTDPAYQLTHDYLVPTTRKWLESQDAGTRVGRVREQMRQIASVWNAKPSSKRLPTLLEWGAIRWFTTKRHWTAAEKRMMDSADRRLGILASSMGLGLFLASSGLYYAFRDVQARFLATRLADIESADVTNVLQQIVPHRRWVFPKLEAISKSQADLAAQTPSKTKFHVGLALFDHHPEQADLVLKNLDQMEDRNLGKVIQYLRTCQKLAPAQILELTQRAFQERSSNALPLAALLCQIDPERPEWSDLAGSVCHDLLQKPSTQLGFWPELFQPIRRNLIPKLLEAGRRQQQTKTESMENVVALLLEWANDDPSSLSKAVGWIPVEYLPRLLKVSVKAQELSVDLRDELTQSVLRIRQTQLPAKNSATDSLVKEFDGYMSENGGWLEHIPLVQLKECIANMKQLGYQPSSLRPYRHKGAVYAAAVWNVGDGDDICQWDMSESVLASTFQAMQKDGYTMLDFSCYEDPLGEEKSSEVEQSQKWLGVWRKSSQSEAEAQVLLLGEDTQAKSAAKRREKVAGLVPFRKSVRINEQGDQLHDSLWGRPDVESPESMEWSRLEFANGDLFPGYMQTDVRCENIAGTSDRSRKWNEYYEFLFAGNAKKRSARELINIANRLSACGFMEDASDLLGQVTDTEINKLSDPERSNVTRGYLRQLARVLARTGKAAELRTLLQERVENSTILAEEKEYLYLRLAILEKDEEAIRGRLVTMENNSDKSSFTRDYFLRALGTIAVQEDFRELAETSLQKLMSTASIWFAKDSDLTDSLLECDFDKLRSNPEWIRFLDQCKLTRRFTNCCQKRDNVETRVITAATALQHHELAMDLLRQGYVPAVVHIHSDPGENAFYASLWQRPRRSIAELASESKQVASLALLLARLGENDAILDGFSEKWGRGVQSDIVAQSKLLLDGNALASLLKNASSIQQQTAILSALGGYEPTDFTESNLRYLLLRLRDLAESAPTVATQNMSRWVLSVWGEELPPMKAKVTLTKDRDWFTNSLGQQLIVFDPPPLCKVGKQEERRCWIRIGRRFAIGSTEVTGREFADFLSDVRVRKWIDQNRIQRWVSLADDRQPQSSISWQLAIRYCQWLNEKENISPDQWCYENVWGEAGDEPVLPSNYLQRIGYRLPTHAEWQWACAGGLEEAWHFGSNESNMPLFEWTMPHSGNRSRVAGSLRPNSFGLFDMSGSLAEWMDDGFQSVNRATHRFYLEDRGNSETDSSVNRILAGGRYKASTQSAATHAFVVNPHSYMSPTTGIRIARTLSQD